MMGRETKDAPDAVAQSVFTTTHWSVVLATAEQDSPHATAALEQLCRTYWYPLYCYVRRRGYGHEDAQDLTAKNAAEVRGRVARLHREKALHSGDVQEALHIDRFSAHVGPLRLTSMRAWLGGFSPPLPVHRWKAREATPRGQQRRPAPAHREGFEERRCDQ